MALQPTSIYIHWPFCKSKCPYCDFNSHVRESINQTDWLQGYLTELASYHEYLQDKEIVSIFFGGGTPSLAEPLVFANILAYLFKNYSISSTVEITIEANPTSIEASKFKEFQLAGINRVSVGIQSLDDTRLKFLGREHTAREALKALDIASNTFDRCSFDLIYATANQTIDAWQEELSQALAIGSKHLSLYQLTIEKGTRFYRDYKNKIFTLPQENLAADMYELTNALCASNGLLAYEISNYARPGEESAHNLCYWRYQDYIGIGPGAHGRYTQNGQKIASIKIYQPEAWLKEVNEKGRGLQKQEIVSDNELKIEQIIMGMRLKEGLPLSSFTGFANFEDKLNILLTEGLLITNGSNITASSKGRLLLNKLIEFICS